jgi:hypothetical protein
VSLEGGLHLGLRVVDGRIAKVRVTSTRPDVARTMLQGRTRAEVSAAVPLLFSICSSSQAAASRLACAAAAGEETTPDMLAQCSAAVSAETVRECAWRTLLDWPRWLDEPPSDDAVAAARASLAFRFDTESGTSRIALAAFGSSAQEWLALDSLAELDRWADAGHTASARFIRRVRDDDVVTAGHALPALLAREHDAAWVAELCDACTADPGFARHPTWRGAPAETGALARLQEDPLLVALMRRSAGRLPARFAARLRELALLIAGRATSAVGVLALPAGGGAAWVENARGLLIHDVRLENGCVETYRIVAPTEWNFHPEGVLAATLVDTPAGNPDALRPHATRLVHSLDPCVTCQVEFDDA